MKIITAHIKKACAEKRIIMEKIKKNVSNIKIKDPGSAITHFIAMLMASKIQLCLSWMIMQYMLFHFQYL